MLNFQHLDVYRCAVTFLGQAAPIADRMPRGYAALGDQLRRAALSVPLNIAEGNGRLRGDASHHYSIARGSALECGAVLDACAALGLVTAEEAEPLNQLIERVVSMLTKMAMK